jgi:hypothetical protein
MTIISSRDIDRRLLGVLPPGVNRMAKGDTIGDIVRRANARQLAMEREDLSFPMNTIWRGMASGNPNMTMHRSASAESDRRDLSGKPPPGRPLDDDNAVVRRCLARMRERQARHDREQAMRDDE